MNQHHPPAIGDRVTFSLENRIAPTEHYEGTVTEFHDIGITAWPTWTMDTNPPTAEDLPAVTVRTDRAGAWIVPIAWIREIDRMPAVSVVPFLIRDETTHEVADPDSLTVFQTAGMTQEELDRAESWGTFPERVGSIGSVADVIADALKWCAFIGDRENLVVCASCVNADGIIQWIDPRHAVAISWDVMGDPRPFVFVCAECAQEVKG